MAKVVTLPLLNSMDLLQCDECKETALNLYMSKDLSCFAYRCIACNFVGYCHTEKEDNDEIQTISTTK